MQFKFNVLSAITLTAILGGIGAKPVSAQLELPAIIEVTDSIKGSTVNQSVQSGNKSAVSFGSSTTFGTSATINATSAAYAASEAVLGLTNVEQQNGCPTGGCIFSSVGGTDGITNADISNIRSTTETNNSSSGNVDLTGIRASNELAIDGDNSSFSAQVHSIHSSNTPGEANTFNNNPNVANISNESQNGSAGSNTIVNTNTNVDINTTNFISSFQQAF